MYLSLSEHAATVVFDEAAKVLTGVNITNRGSNYSKPKVVIVDGDGQDATFNIIVRNGELFSITLDNPGRGYTYAPEIKIIESDVEAYVESDTIGVPQSVRITDNGGAYHLDKTVSSTFSSKYVVSLKDIVDAKYKKGELVTQTVGGVEVFRAKVAEYRLNSNLLKLEDIQGTIREDVAIVGYISNATATVKSVFVSTFKEEISSFYDNIGYFKSDKGRLGVSNQRMIDSDFYQDYSYVIKSKTPIDEWRDLIKSTTHPAGFKLFGQVDVEATASTEMPVEIYQSHHILVLFNFGILIRTRLQ